MRVSLGSRGDGNYRNGPLFGEHKMGRLTVRHVAHSGLPVAQMREDHALELDLQCVLGFPEGPLLEDTDNVLLSADQPG